MEHLAQNVCASTAAVSNPAGNNSAGVAISSGSYGGFIGVTRDSNTPVEINRKTNDGNLITFRKDGSTVGSIGAFNGYPYIGGSGTTDSFIRFWDASQAAIYPATSTGATNDAAINIGGSAQRFKDLYLSGGVYLGGIGAANKLDDYEEGTWTVTMEPSAGFTATNNTSTGYYTKIGNVVTVSGIAQMTTPASLGTWSNNSISFALLVSGLPFNLGSSVGRRSAPVLGIVSTIGWDSGNVLMGHGSSGGDDFNIFQCKASGATRTSPNLASNSAHNLHFGFTYTTD